jgi:hypothetical protein
VVLCIPSLHLLYLSGLECPGVRGILGTVNRNHIIRITTAQSKPDYHVGPFIDDELFVFSF